MSAAYKQIHFRLDYFMGANNVNPYQTAPKPDLGPYYLQYRLPYNINRRGAHEKSCDWQANDS